MLEVIPDSSKNDNMKTLLFLFCGYYSRLGAWFLR